MKATNKANLKSLNNLKIIDFKHQQSILGGATGGSSRVYATSDCLEGDSITEVYNDNNRLMYIVKNYPCHVVVSDTIR